MINNSQSLMDKCRALAQKNNITVNEVLQNYMFERILERLSVSKYKFYFILKGGLLLSSIMGLDTRTTMDMDACVKGMNLTDEQLYSVLNEILGIDVNDGVTFEIRNSKPIREDDDYGGLKYNLFAIFDNLRIPLSIDIATGDEITPREIEYDYKTLFDNRELKIMTYNIESIIAEKFQTVISRGILNSRMKDYYDLYYLINNEEYSSENLKNAVNRTFLRRETNINSIGKVIDEISNDDFIRELWFNYANKHSYAQNVKFESIIGCFKKIKEFIST